MDFNRIFNASLKWFSVPKAILFILFFWLSLSLLFLIPWDDIILDSLFYFLQIFYGIIILVTIFSLLLLTWFVLYNKKFKLVNFSFTVFVDSLFLVLMEIFYVFFWNKNKKYRVVQLLLIFGMLLMSYYSFLVTDLFVSFSFLFFTIFYFVLVFYNCIRLSFSIPSFYSKKLSIKKSIEESWKITDKNFSKIFYAYCIILFSAVGIFLVSSIILGIISNVFLLLFLNQPIAYRLSVTFGTVFALAPAIITYYFGFAELYYQVQKKENISKKKVSKKKPVKKKASKKKKK